MPFKIDFAYDNMMSTFILNTITHRYHHTHSLFSSFTQFYFLNLMGLSVYQYLYRLCRYRTINTANTTLTSLSSTNVLVVDDFMTIWCEKSKILLFFSNCQPVCRDKHNNSICYSQMFPCNFLHRRQ